MQTISYIIDNYNFIFFIIFGTSLFIQLLYYYILFIPFSFYRQKDPNEQRKKPVSIIICAKNEALNLDKNLPFILEQDYPDYEVVVVNDCSSDNTDEILGRYLALYPHLKTTVINEDKKFSHNKKLAILVGIKAAKNEILIFTDADCRPLSNQWIEKIQRNFDEQKSMVLGYGSYKKSKGLLNKYIRYETLFIAIQYLSYAIAKIPYMGVGRNLAYKKSLFYDNKGFASHHHIASGDDDLFVNESANKFNTKIEISEESITQSIPEVNLASWIKQKRRHLTTGKHYKFMHKFLLGMEYISRFLFYSSFIYLLAIEYNLYIILPLFGLRFFTQFIVFKKSMNKLNEKNLLVNTFIFDILSLFINFVFYITNRKTAKTLKWK